MLHDIVNAIKAEGGSVGGFRYKFSRAFNRLSERRQWQIFFAVITVGVAVVFALLFGGVGWLVSLFADVSLSGWATTGGIIGAIIGFVSAGLMYGATHRG